MDNEAEAFGEEDLQPQLETLKVFEQDGERFRIYVTMCGAIAVDRFDSTHGTWGHVPLRHASKSDVSDVLAARYHTEDEELARSLEAHGA